MNLISKFTAIQYKAPKSASTRNDADLPLITSAKRPKPSQPQLVLDRVPRHMEMREGDQYFVPPVASSIRIDVEWARSGKAAVEVDVNVILLEQDLKRWDYVTPQRKISRDKAVALLGEDGYSSSLASSKYTKRESIGIKLKQISPDVAYIVIFVTVKSSSKTIADLIGPSVSMVDAAYYPGTPELLRYDFEAEERFFPGAALLLISCDRRSTAQSDKTRLWTANALEAPLIGRSFKQVSEDIEEAVKSYQTSAKLSTERSYGGDAQRVLAEKLTLKAEQVADEQTIKVKKPEVPPAVVTESDSDQSDESETGSLKLFYIHNGISTYDAPESVDKGLRPTIVRKGKRSYTVGRGLQTKNEESDSDEVSEDEDQEMFQAAFPQFTQRDVTRYGSRTYNIGTSNPSLLHHYSSHKEDYNRQLCDASVNASKPLEVAQVRNVVEGSEAEDVCKTKPDLPVEMQRLARMTPRSPLIASDNLRKPKPPDFTKNLPSISPRQRKRVSKFM